MLWGHQSRFQSVFSLESIYSLAQSYHYLPSLLTFSFLSRFFAHMTSSHRHASVASLFLRFLIVELLIHALFVAFYAHSSAGQSFIFSPQRTVTQVLFFPLQLSSSLLDASLAFICSFEHVVGTDLSPPWCLALCSSFVLRLLELELYSPSCFRSKLFLWSYSLGSLL